MSVKIATKDFDHIDHLAVSPMSGMDADHTVEFKDFETGSITAGTTSSQSLDYLRMENECFMEEASVLSAGAWVERDSGGYECA